MSLSCFPNANWQQMTIILIARLLKKNSEKKKKIQWRHTALFLFSGLLKQVNIVVELNAKQNVRFSHLFPFQWFFSPVGQKFSNKNLYHHRSIFVFWSQETQKLKTQKRKEKKYSEDNARFLFFGLLKQVNIVVEDKTKGAILAPFYVSVILFSGWPKILKQKSLLSH